MNQIELKMTFSISAAKLYKAWLDPLHHVAMSWGEYAEIDPVVDGLFTCGDGYIFGKNLELDPGKRIVQAWRTTDFPDDQPDTQLELLFTDTEDGCEFTLIHNGFPEDQVETYAQGWLQYYLEPMKLYFGG